MSMHCSGAPKLVVESREVYIALLCVGIDSEESD
jgi:hypothetical protein